MTFNLGSSDNTYNAPLGDVSVKARLHGSSDH